LLRKHLSISNSRVVGETFIFLFCVFIEFLQFNNILIYGNIFDPYHILMYTIGVILGLLVDITIINNFEKLIK